ncbi:MAG: polysaccharide biosynthesis C-terminal domain-containing protein [Thermonemataceae bacterium]|nr:polysaccharide biosynthesis C-terminal domain-containing protein [Thermonemataceae bacterium]
MSSLRSLASDTVWYGLSNIISRLGSYLLTPIHTKIFLPEQYGIISDLYIYVAFLNVIYTFGTETSYFRFANDFDEKKIYNQNFTSLLLYSLFLSGSMLVFASPISSFLGYEGKEHYIWYLSLLLAVDTLLSLPFARLRWLKKQKLFAFAKFFNIALYIFLNIFFLWFCNGIAQGEYLVFLQDFMLTWFDTKDLIAYVFLAQLLANAPLLWLLRKEILSYRFSWDKTLAKKVFSYSYPLVILGLAGTLNSVSDRFFIKNYLPETFGDNMKMVGVYGAAIKFSVFISVLIQGYRFAAEPFFFAKAKDKNAPELLAQAMKYFVIVACIAVLGVSLNLDWLKLLLLRNRVYDEGLVIVPVFLFANLFLGVYYNLTAWFKIADKTQFGTYITLIGAFITIISNLALLPVLGILGSAVASLLTYFSMSFLSYYWGQRYFPIPYNLYLILGYILFAAVLVYLASWLDTEAIFLKIMLKNALLLLFIVPVFFLERSVLLIFWYKIKKRF